VTHSFVIFVGPEAPTQTRKPRTQTPKGPDPRALERYFRDHTFPANGATIPFDLLYRRFRQSLPPTDRSRWSKLAFSKATATRLKGRRTRDGVHCFGNVAFTPWREGDPVLEPLVLEGDRLRSKKRRRTLSDRLRGC